MDFSAFFEPRTLAAFGVAAGALLGGFVSLAAELRRGGGVDQQEKTAPPQLDETALRTIVSEECEHVSRAVWLVERRLSERLRKLEIAAAAGAGAP